MEIFRIGKDDVLAQDCTEENISPSLFDTQLLMLKFILLQNESYQHFKPCQKLSKTS